MNLRPQAIGNHFCCFLTVAPLSASLPAEEGAPGYAENRIRYSNVCMCSPTSTCVFRGQPSLPPPPSPSPSSPPSFFFPWQVNQINLKMFSDVGEQKKSVYVFACMREASSCHFLCETKWFKASWRGRETAGWVTPSFLHGCPRAAVLSNSQQRIDFSCTTTVSNKQTGRGKREKGEGRGSG